MLPAGRTIVLCTIAASLCPVAALSAQAGGGAANTMKVTIASGPDRGTHTVELGAKSNGQNTCSVMPRADRQAGSYFNGHFYPEMNDKPGLMEAVTAFNVGPNGSTNEASFAVTFLSGKGADMTMRAYEAETRPGFAAKGRVSATFAKSGGGATARVEGETAEGVKVTLEIACKAVSDQLR